MPVLEKVDLISLHEGFPDVTKLSASHRVKIVRELTKLDQLIPVLEKVQRDDIDNGLLVNIAYDCALNQLVVRDVPTVSFDKDEISPYLEFLNTSELERSLFFIILRHLLVIIEKIGTPVPESLVDFITSEVYYILPGQMVRQLANLIELYAKSVQSPKATTTTTTTTTIQLPVSKAEEQNDTVMLDQDTEETISAAQRQPDTVWTQSSNASPQKTTEAGESASQVGSSRIPSIAPDVEEPLPTENDEIDMVERLRFGLLRCAQELDHQTEVVSTLIQSFEIEMPLLASSLNEESANRKESIKIFANYFDSKIQKIFDALKGFESTVNSNERLQYLMLNAQQRLDSLSNISDNHTSILKDLDAKVIELRNENQQGNPTAQADAANKELERVIKRAVLKIKEKFLVLENHFRQALSKCDKIERDNHDFLSNFARLVKEFENFKNVVDPKKIDENTEKCLESSLANEFEIDLLKQEILRLKEQIEALKRAEPNSQIRELQTESKKLKSQIEFLHRDREKRERFVMQMFARVVKLEAHADASYRQNTSVPVLPTKRAVSHPQINEMGPKSPELILPDTDVLKRIKLMNHVSDEEASQQSREEGPENLTGPSFQAQTPIRSVRSADGQRNPTASQTAFI